jgi:hypothetical protein
MLCEDTVLIDECMCSTAHPVQLIHHDGTDTTSVIVEWAMSGLTRNHNVSFG